eukprot:jgi/Chrzof1/15083/Cz09g26170.t1
MFQLPAHTVPQTSRHIAVVALYAIVALPSSVSAQAGAQAVVQDDYYASLLVVSGFLVFFMQVGFVALETGSGRAKNVRNILLKNLVDVMLCAICWWAVGFAFAHGKTAGGIIGYTGFFFEGDYITATRPWFFSWTFAVACCTIVSGCLAERTRLIAYPVYTVVISVIVHPIMVHWVWASDSWMASVSYCQVLDFAGGTVVHFIGGLFGLIGAAMCGPRLGRFDEGVSKDIPGHDMAFVTLGTFMLWFGWYGFNTGSVYLYDTPSAEAVQRAAVNTTLGASASGLVALLVASWTSGTYDLRLCCNGVLAGLVTVTSMCGFIDPWAAVVCGSIAGAVYIFTSMLMLKLRIDDPLDSAAVHAGNGFLGMILVAFVAKPAHVAALTGTSCGGIFYTSAGWMQLAMQLLALVIVGAFTSVCACVVFLALKRRGVLRVDHITELAGIDNMEHGGPAYPEFNLTGANPSVHGGVLH